MEVDKTMKEDNRLRGILRQAPETEDLLGNGQTNYSSAFMVPLKISIVTLGFFIFIYHQCECIIKKKN